MLKDNVVWCQGKSGNVLNNQKNQTNAVMCVVGRVPDNRLNCGPQGNFNWKYGGLHTSKFQLQLSKPYGTPFEDDFQKGIDIMCNIQEKTTTTNDRRYFICAEGNYTNLRFGQNVFVKRPHKIDDEAGEVVDDETEKWPVSDNLLPDLQEVKHEYQVRPLSVFQNDKPVKTDEVNNILKGALVELHFELHHYHIRIKESNTNFDCFNATIEQIIILQTSGARPSSAYKRKNIGQGPIRMVSAAALHRTRDSDTDEGSQLGGPSSGVLPFPNGGASVRLLICDTDEKYAEKENQSADGEGDTGKSRTKPPKKTLKMNDATAAPLQSSLQASNEHNSLDDSEDDMRQGKKKRMD
ncbi:hypothetical protein EDB83DRAFT_2224081 [Lactarius deliciosus]|nr:hypothetical protein EDB83DRAFT_2224081 [Lactarius deliciosus]